MGQAETATHPKDARSSTDAIGHRVVVFYPLFAKIDGCSSPVRIGDVDRENDEVLREDVEFLGPSLQVGALISHGRQPFVEERIEVMDIHRLSIACSVPIGHLESLVRSSLDHCAVEIDDFVVEPCEFESTEGRCLDFDVVELDFERGIGVMFGDLPNGISMRLHAMVWSVN